MELILSFNPAFDKVIFEHLRSITIHQLPVLEEILFEDVREPMGCAWTQALSTVTNRLQAEGIKVTMVFH